MRKTILFVLCILILGFLGICPIIGLAQSLDQIIVADDANIFGNRLSEVEAAANKLLTLGADVRVRTIQTYGAAGNLDQYEAQLEQQSPSWVDQDGFTKNNLIVLIIALQERQSGLYYGLYWKDLIDANWLRIQSNIMHPLFSESDYAGGTIKGLEEIERLIKATGQNQTDNQTTTGQSKVWIIPLVIIVIVGLVVGWFLFSRFRKNRAKLSTARQKAILAKQAAASEINKLIETTQMLAIKVNVTADKIASEDAGPLRSGLEKAEELVNESAQTYSELSHSAGDPENPKLREAELGVVESEYQKILGQLHESQKAIQEVEERVAGVQQTIDGFPGKVAEVNALIEEAFIKEKALRTSGFKTVDIIDLIKKGRSTLEQAQDMVSQKRLNDGLQHINLASEQIKQAVQVADELPKKKQEVEAAISALELRIEQVKETVNQGSDVFERLFQQYAESSWESIRGNGTEAENRVNSAIGALDDARTATRMEQQEWHKAQELVEKSNTWLTEAESLVKSISQLENNLIAARRDAPDEINAAKVDVMKAWEYIHRYDEDIREVLEDELNTAEQKNNIAREELNKQMPDYLMICKLAREANESADKILIQARDEHEAAERLRTKAASTRRDAYTKVSIARQYIEDHYSVVKNEARTHLNNAVGTLAEADAAVDINTQISLASNAETAASTAYSLAQQDVNGNWERRRPTSYQSTTNIPNIIIPPVIIAPTGHTSRPTQSWGARRPSSRPSSGTTVRRGGGSSGWSSRGSGSSGGGSRRGGGSSGW